MKGQDSVYIYIYIYRKTPVIWLKNSLLLSNNLTDKENVSDNKYVRRINGIEEEINGAN